MNRTWFEAAQLLGLHFELGIVLVLLALHASERFVHRRRQGRVRRICALAEGQEPRHRRGAVTDRTTQRDFGQ